MTHHPDWESAMRLQIIGAAKRLILSLLLACGLAGCAIYGPPHGAYGAGYGPSYGYSGYPTYPYSSSYAYGGPAYAYPPVSLDLGFTYYDRGSRRDGGHGWGHRHRSGEHWRGNHRGDGGHRHRGHGRQ